MSEEKFYAVCVTVVLCVMFICITIEVVVEAL